jgi:hypothetical protein
MSVASPNGEGHTVLATGSGWCHVQCCHGRAAEGVEELNSRRRPSCVAPPRATFAISTSQSCYQSITGTH